jgi:signal transduction histidine kinase
VNIDDRKSIKTGGGADLAFALIVLAAYLVNFSEIGETSPLHLLTSIILGVVYITNGVYGYAYVAKSGTISIAILYFSIQLFVGGWIFMLSKGALINSLIFLPLVGHSVLLLPSMWTYVGNVAIILVYIIALRWDWRLIWAQLPGFIAGQVFVATFIQMAVNEERARFKVEDLARQLTEANYHLTAYANQVEELTLIKERNRLAREIHDGLGHYLTTINMQIQAASSVLAKDPQKAENFLSKASVLTKEAIADVRQSVDALRVLPDDGVPIEKRITKLIDAFTWEDKKITISVFGQARPLSAQAEVTLYRAVQEGLTNIEKHASDATEVTITLNYRDPGFVQLIIHDNGSHRNMRKGTGFGLISLLERAGILGGNLNVATSPGEGSSLEITIPE